jgi:hypothetical protein
MVLSSPRGQERCTMCSGVVYYYTTNVVYMYVLPTVDVLCTTGSVVCRYLLHVLCHVVCILHVRRSVTVVPTATLRSSILVVYYVVWC